MAPRVSVVVPVYNVEAYLAECLESLARQSLADLEVVMVDDGSTDGSPAIAAEFAARDPRFRLVRQANAGLGAARNAGVPHATGEFLAFVDSDDVVPEHAYDVMVASLDASGSDFVAGNVRRLTPFGSEQSAMHRRTFARTRRNTHVTRDPLLLFDRTAWNKLFRRSFWDRHAFRFPEGVLYEDIPVTIPAHLLAESVDALNDDVYYWREREGGEKSITQRRTELKGLRDRVAAVSGVSAFIGEHAGVDLQRRYDSAALMSDIRIFVNALPEADDEFRQVFLDVVNAYLDRVDERAYDELTSINRLKYHLVRRRLMDELLTVVQHERGRLKRTRVVQRGLRFYARYPFYDDRGLAIPAHVYRLDRELVVRSAITDLRWEGDRIVVEGWAYVDFVDIPDRRLTRTIAAAVTGSRRRPGIVPLRVKQVRTPQPDEASGRPRQRLEWSGFRFELDATRLRRRGGWREGRWRIYLGVLTRGVLAKGRLRNPEPGRPQRPAGRRFGDVVVRPEITSAGTLEIVVERPRATVDQHAGGDGTLTLAGTLDPRLARSAAGAVAPRLLLRRPAGSAELAFPATVEQVDGRSRWRATVVLDELLHEVDVADLAAHAEQVGTGIDWQVSLDADGRSGPVPLLLDAEPGRVPHAGREVLVRADRYGHVAVSEGRPRPTVERAAWLPDDRLRLDGTCAAWPDQPFTLVWSAKEWAEQVAVPAERDGEQFTAVVDPWRVTSLAGSLPLRAGRWELLARPAGGDGEAATVSVRVGGGLPDQLPVTRSVRGKQATFTDVDVDQLMLDVSLDVPATDRSARAQWQLAHREYLRQARRPLRDAVLLNSYTGRQFSDSPRAVYEELVRRGTDLELLWVVRDQQAELPDGLRPVALWSREWHEALATSRYVITNQHLPPWYRRRDGQVCVQTWHGTPLKRIGFDIENIRFAQGNYHERLRVECANWSHLVSPNRFSTPILRRAFGFTGTLLETGYPRNDVLRSPRAEEIAAATRKRIGVPDGVRVALYTPTWRDDRFYGPGKYKLDLRLDLARARARLGADWALLIRRHPNVVDRIPGAGEGFVHDVSDYPDIAELYLASDALITDYSSVMFDYANLGRPMLFFTYDLEDYRDNLRGFYFDFEATAPGPLLATSDEVIDALANLDEVAAGHADRYAAFVTAYCDLDDGHATARVVDAVLDGG